MISTMSDLAKFHENTPSTSILVAWLTEKNFVVTDYVDKSVLRQLPKKNARASQTPLVNRLGAKTPVNKRARESQTQKTPSKQGSKGSQRTSPGGKVKSKTLPVKPAKKKAKPSAVLESKQKFNNLARRAKKSCWLGFVMLNPGLLREPFPETEDRNFSEPQVEKITNEILEHNTWATPNPFSVAIVNTPDKIAEFRRGWEECKAADLATMSQFINTWLNDNQDGMYFYILKGLIVILGYTQSGNHNRISTTRLQQEKEDEKEEWAFLWERLAEIYVFSLQVDGKLSAENLDALRVIGTAQNRVDDAHEGIDVADLLQQYRRAWLELLERKNGEKPTSAETRKTFSTIGSMGQEKYKGVIKPIAKISNPNLYSIIQDLFRSNGESLMNGRKRGKARSTAPFEGMFAKWQGHTIPESIKFQVLKSFRDGILEQKDMKKTWWYEFNKVIFIVYVNGKFKKNLGDSEYTKALELIPPSHRKRIDEKLREAKIKTRVNQRLALPTPIPEILKLAARSKSNMSLSKV